MAGGKDEFSTSYVSFVVTHEIKVVLQIQPIIGHTILDREGDMVRFGSNMCFLWTPDECTQHYQCNPKAVILKMCLENIFELNLWPFSNLWSGHTNDVACPMLWYFSAALRYLRRIICNFNAYKQTMRSIFAYCPHWCPDLGLLYWKQQWIS